MIKAKLGVPIRIRIIVRIRIRTKVKVKIWVNPKAYGLRLKFKIRSHLGLKFNWFILFSRC